MFGDGGEGRREDDLGNVEEGRVSPHRGGETDLSVIPTDVKSVKVHEEEGLRNRHAVAGANRRLTFHKADTWREIIVFKIPCKRIYTLCTVVKSRRRGPWLASCQGGAWAPNIPEH